MFFIRKIRQHFTKPSVSVFVPAFQAESFICETLDSLNEQVFQDFKLLISIDKSDDDTELVVKKWCKEHKKISTRIFCQKHHLGWVKNTNFLLKKCKTKYFMIMPHDDLLDKTYLQKMVQCLKGNLRACAAFSDIQSFGTIKSITTQNSIRGERLERTVEFLQNYGWATAFRGLVNRAVLSDFKLIPENDHYNFAADTLWNLQMVLNGELIRVPEVLYHKRYHVNQVRTYWMKLGKQDKLNAWLEHCKDCLKVIFSAGFLQYQMVHLIKASYSRLLQDVTPLWESEIILLNLNKEDRDSLVENLEKTIIALGEAENYSSSQLLQSKHI